MVCGAVRGGLRSCNNLTFKEVYMNNQEMIDKTHEITDQLEHEASVRLNAEQAYYNGYVQACEDYGRRVRGAIIQGN